MIAARNMEQWFADFVFDAERQADQLPDMTRQRLERQFGIGIPAAQLRQMTDVLLQLPGDERQTTFAMYICGYPEEMIDRLGVLKLSVVLQEVDAVFPPPQKIRRRSKVTKSVLRRTVAPEAVGVDERLQNTTVSPNIMDDFYKTAGRRGLLAADEEVTHSKHIEAGLFANEKLDTDDGTLDPAYKRELLHIKKQGERAFDIMLESNLRLVASIARTYRMRSGMEDIDLLQEGSIGLVNAIQKFDYTKGFKFSTYATWGIRQAIIRSIADKDRMIRLPVHMIDRMNKTFLAYSILEKKLNHAPTREELALDVGLSVEKIDDLFRLKQEHMSLNMRIGDSEQEFGGLIVDDDSRQPDRIVQSRIQHEENKALLDTIFDQLTDIEKNVFRIRRGLDGQDPKTLGETGTVLNMSALDVRKIESRAMQRIRAQQQLKSPSDTE